MSQACHRFLTRCTIPCACQAKRRFNVQKWREQVVFCTFWPRNVLRTTTACTFLTAQLLKVLWSWVVLYILTSKFASRHNSVHFFDSSTSKSAPELRCLYILTWKRASRHNGVQLFISHLASWLRTRRFSKPTFRPSGATNHWKNTVFRDFPTFWRTWIFLLRRLALFDLLSSFFFLLLFSSLLFSSLLWLFPSLLFICPYCRKFDFETTFDNFTPRHMNYLMLRQKN